MLHSINYCMCVFLKFICIYFFLYYRGPCVRKLFTGLIMYLPSQNKEHCIVLYCIVLYCITLGFHPCDVSLDLMIKGAFLHVQWIFKAGQ